jgi:hypothetical protein
LFGIGSKTAHSLSLFHTGGRVTATLFKAAAHGISRALISKAQGGRWSSSFWSGFASSALSVGTRDYGGVTGRTMIMAVVGGTVSELTGGKFANGAVSGAFVHLFNAEGVVHKYIKSLSMRQIMQVSDFKHYIKKMDVKTFNKYFGLNVTERELDMYKLDIYSQLNPFVIKGLYDITTQAIKDIGGVRSSFAPVKSVYHILGPNGKLGYDFIKGTTTLRGIYEID